MKGVLIVVFCACSICCTMAHDCSQSGSCLGVGVYGIEDEYKAKSVKLFAHNMSAVW